MSVSIKPGAWRLGNFMFQFAAAASLALDNEVDFIEPEFGYGKFFKRDYRIFGKRDNPIFTVREPLNFAYKKIPYNGPTMIDGYFQSEKYFKHNEQYIKDIFARTKIVKPDDNVVYAINNRESAEQQYIAVHVRRGDYANYPEHHPIMSMDYYNSAMEVFYKFCKPHFFIFSDDHKWCKENFKKDATVVEGGSDIEDFHTMTLCDHSIIANSSFSWWSAWLGHRPGKEVVAPDPHIRWFGSALKHYDMSDLLPNEWITV